MRVRAFISANRWPIFLGGLLTMPIIAYTILVYVATRPDAPRPIPDYYKRSLSWDADQALIEASRQLGWKVNLAIPKGAQYSVGRSRPVDLTVTDSAGQPVSGLVGRLVAIRPSDTRLNSDSALTELPHAPGHYRTLAQLGMPGIWELNLDTRRGDTRFAHSQRVTLTRERGK